MTFSLGAFGIEKAVSYEIESRATESENLVSESHLFYNLTSRLTFSFAPGGDPTVFLAVLGLCSVTGRVMSESSWWIVLANQMGNGSISVQPGV